MPPSLSVVERANPPPRRKSCSACITAKRRCDLRYPACLRCSQRSIHCCYPTGAATIREGSSHSIPNGERPAIRTPVACEPVLNDWFEGFEPFEPQETSPGSCPRVTSLSLPMGEPNLASMGFLFDASEPAENQLAAISDDSSPSLSSVDLIPKPSSTLFPPRTRLFDSVSVSISTRLQYSIDELRYAPTRMVLENQTPWSHSLLYRDNMPRSLLDAYACCALYMAKNHTNAPVILRSIETRVDDLLSSPVPSDGLGVLARTQALLLYQIICLFDGDIRARATADRTVLALETMGHTLRTHIFFDDAGPPPLQFAPATTIHKVISLANPSVFSPPAAPTSDDPPRPRELPLDPIGPTISFWHSWIFQESARRTFLITFFFLQTYRLLSNQTPLTCDGKLYLCHSWTMSAYLWGAQNAVGFAKAWRDHKHFIVTNANFTQVLAEARADDVGTFGKMLLSALMGIEEARGWLVSRGGNL